MPKLPRFADNPTRGYQPGGGQALGAWSYLSTGEPWFTWADVPAMSRDPDYKEGVKAWMEKRPARWVG